MRPIGYYKPVIDITIFHMAYTHKIDMLIIHIFTHQPQRH